MAALAIACFAGISKTNVDIGVTSVDGTHEAVSGLNLYIGPNLMLCKPDVRDNAPLINTPPSLSAVTEFAPDAILAAFTSVSIKVDESIEFFIFILH